jgi:hypothetical protein
MMDVWLTPTGVEPRTLWRNFRSRFLKSYNKILRKVGNSFDAEEKFHCMTEEKIEIMMFKKIL